MSRLNILHLIPGVPVFLHGLLHHLQSGNAVSTHQGWVTPLKLCFSHIISPDLSACENVKETHLHLFCQLPPTKHLWHQPHCLLPNLHLCSLRSETVLSDNLQPQIAAVVSRSHNIGRCLSSFALSWVSPLTTDLELRSAQKQKVNYQSKD